MTGKIVPAVELRRETTVIDSRFITTVAPTFTVEEAKAFISRIKGEFTAATHNVPAFIIGHGASVSTHCSDDGEPSGTAGRPILSVLMGSGLGDIAVVVTRYFGGTKLGTGGLVRAYGNAVRDMLLVLPRAEKVLTHLFRMTIPYSLYQKTVAAISTHKGFVLTTEYAQDIRITGKIRVDLFPALQQELNHFSAGKISPEITLTEYSLLPLPSEDKS